MNVSRMLNQWLLMAMFAFLHAPAFGQGFLKTYLPANASCRDLLQTPDGGYFMAGHIGSTGQMFLQKTNPVGNVVWANHLSLGGARAIATCLATDGSLVVLAENFNDAGNLKNLVLKLSPTGTLLWQDTIDNTFLPNGLRDIITTSDGNLLAVGDTRDGQLNQDIWLIKFDADGNTLWSQKFGDVAFNEQVSRLIELPNGDIAVCGAGMHGSNRDLFLARADADGNLLWEHWYNKPATQISYDILSMSDGGLMLLGDTYGTNPTTITLLKTDADGTESFFSQLYPWPISAVNSIYTINSFVRDATDNVYIPGFISDSIGTTIGFLLKVDISGNAVWVKNLPIPSIPPWVFIATSIPWQIINTADNKFAIGGEYGHDSNEGAFLLKTTLEGELYSNRITGSIFNDMNDNCTEDAGEQPLSNFIVRAENQWDEVFFKNVAPDGTFSILVSEGDFEVSISQLHGTQSFWLPCDTPAVTVAGEYQTEHVGAIGLRSFADCPLMFVEIGTNFLRRCMSNQFNVVYCNNGSVVATDVSVQITIDPAFTYDNSSIPLENQTGNVLTFNLPDVAPADCGSFKVNLGVDCQADLGDVLCVEAHIFPDTFCIENNPLWDGSHLEVTGSCDGDVKFTITNTGENMTGIVEYVIVEDQIMYMQGAIQLDAGEDTVITVTNPTGGPYFIQLPQSTGHPGLSLPSALVAACGGPAMSSALQFPSDEADVFIARHCDEVIGSYDPNDKRGFPLGWKDAHYIERGQDLEYMIRFQNTGTDTAFLVVVQDTLSTLLDPASVRPGPSSHPYTWELDFKGVLTFTFPNILLVDSFKNEPASHGYVMFSVAQQPDLPLGTVIENTAAIYFDFNDPIFTNTYFHTLGKPFTTFVKDPSASSIDLQIFPNPFSEQTRFRLNGVAADASVRLSLFDALGQLTRQENFTGADYLFQKNELSAGIYFFKMEENGRLLASGKVVVAK